jgi:SPP1 family predicted phage head-tail adaptor
MSIYDTTRKTGPKLIAKFANENTIDHQRRTNSPDGYGGNAVTWSSVATISGAVIPLSGNEIYQQDRLNQNVSHAVYVTNTAGTGITTGDRFVFRGRTLDIKWSENIAEADAGFKFLCEEGSGS